MPVYQLHGAAVSHLTHYIQMAAAGICVGIVSVKLTLVL